MPYKNKEDLKARNKRYQVEHKEEIAAQRARTKDSRAATHRTWRLSHKAERAASMRAWRNIPGNRIASNLRSRICNVLRGKTKFLKLADSVGCSVEELKAWISGGWDSGMTWENYGAWEIDHRRPCASFDLSNPEEQRRCFHYLNLQPLWKSDNRRKNDSYELRLR